MPPPTMASTTLSAVRSPTTLRRATPIARTAAITPSRSLTDTAVIVPISSTATNRLTLPRITATCRK